MAEATKRMTNKAIQRLLARMAEADGGTERRISLLYAALPEELQALVHGGAKNPIETTSGQRLKQYIEAREELFGRFGIRSALQLVLGVEVSDRLIARLYEEEVS